MKMIKHIPDYDGHDEPPKRHNKKGQITAYCANWKHPKAIKDIKLW